MGLASFVAIAAIGICYRIYVQKADLPGEDATLKGWNLWAANKFYVDELYDAIVVRPLEKSASWLHSIVDGRIIDGLVNAVGALPSRISRLARLLQNGNIAFYLFGMVLGIILILILNFVMSTDLL